MYTELAKYGVCLKTYDHDILYCMNDLEVLPSKTYKGCSS